VAVLEGVDGSEGIAIGPGAKWELPEGSESYLLDLLAGGGIQLHFDYVDAYYRQTADHSTPASAEIRGQCGCLGGANPQGEEGIGGWAPRVPSIRVRWSPRRAD